MDGVWQVLVQILDRAGDGVRLGDKLGHGLHVDEAFPYGTQAGEEKGCISVLR